MKRRYKCQIGRLIFGRSRCKGIVDGSTYLVQHSCRRWRPPQFCHDLRFADPWWRREVRRCPNPGLSGARVGPRQRAPYRPFHKSLQFPTRVTNERDRQGASLARQDHVGRASHGARAKRESRHTHGIFQAPDRPAVSEDASPPISTPFGRSTRRQPWPASRGQAAVRVSSWRSGSTSLFPRRRSCSVFRCRSMAFRTAANGRTRDR